MVRKNKQDNNVLSNLVSCMVLLESLFINPYNHYKLYIGGQVSPLLCLMMSTYTKVPKVCRFFFLFTIYFKPTFFKKSLRSNPLTDLVKTWIDKLRISLAILASYLSIFQLSVPEIWWKQPKVRFFGSHIATDIQ